MGVIYGTMAILVICTVTHFYTVSHLTAVTALKQMDPEFEAVSQSLKQPFYKMFVKVTVPVCLPAILDISIYLFVNAMTTVSAVVFLYSPDTTLASVAVLNMDDAGDIAPAAAMGMMIFYTNAGVRILHTILTRGIHDAHPGLARAMIRALILALLVSARGALPWRPKQRVDVELVFLADASRSIDDGEIRFQRQGYAAALAHPEVLAAIAGGYEQKIAVTYVEWGDAASQEVVVPWRVIEGPDSAAAFAKDLLATPRLATGPNAIGSALAFGHGMILANDYEGTRKVIDFSADSAWSMGGVPILEARAAALADGIVINGLAILCRAEDCGGRPIDYDLEAAFAALITGGPGSFVVTADSRTRFAAAVRRKISARGRGAVLGAGTDGGAARLPDLPGKVPPNDPSSRFGATCRRPLPRFICSRSP